MCQSGFYQRSRMFICSVAEIWLHVTVGRGWKDSVSLVYFHLMLYLEVWRAGSHEGKMDVKWSKLSTNCNNLPINWKLNVLVSHHLQIWWCWCPAEEVGKLYYGPKYASSSRVRDGGRAFGTPLPCASEASQQLSTEMLSRHSTCASSQASDYESNVDAASRSPSKSHTE